MWSSKMYFGMFGVFCAILWSVECFYEIQYQILYIWTYLRSFVETFFEHLVFGNDGDATPVFLCICKLLLRPWYLSHRVERQKRMVNSREEMSVRFRKGGFVANLLYVRILAPIWYSKLWNDILVNYNIYIYIYTYQ